MIINQDREDDGEEQTDLHASSSRCASYVNEPDKLPLLTSQTLPG